jgi:hypothetical protein
MVYHFYMAKKKILTNELVTTLKDKYLERVQDNATHTTIAYELQKYLEEVYGIVGHRTLMNWFSKWKEELYIQDVTEKHDLDVSKEENYNSELQRITYEKIIKLGKKESTTEYIRLVDLMDKLVNTGIKIQTLVGRKTTTTTSSALPANNSSKILLDSTCTEDDVVDV